MRQAVRFSCGFAAVAAAVLMVSCGGSESWDEEEIRAVFADYQEAVEDGDAETLCQDILAPSQLEGTSVERCVRDFERAFQRQESQQLGADELGDISIEDGSARAENATTGGFVEFAHEEGRWGLILVR